MILLLFILKKLELQEEQKFAYLIVIGGIGFVLGGTFDCLISI